MGWPAATKPTIGIPKSTLFFSTIPLDAPERMDINPFFSIALRCCSAAFADLNPSVFAMSALVGGNPLFF